MATQVIEYWEVSYYDSIAIGSSSTRFLGNFTDELEARKHAKGKGDWGRDANVNRKRIVIHETIEDIENYNAEETRKRALNKLTDAEKKALGITDVM